MVMSLFILTGLAIVIYLNQTPYQPRERDYAYAGSFYAFPRVDRHYRAGRQGSVALAEYLLEEARVAVVPGIAFGDDRHLRISFACSRQMLRAGLERTARALAG